MSVITIQLGQYGNQVGADLMNLIMHDAAEPPRYTKLTNKENKFYKQEVVDRFFTEVPEKHNSDISYQAKSVMVDMEPKVISKVVDAAKSTGLWSYNATNQYIQRKGSGNNWALGYHKHGPDSYEPVLELVRREVERCDYVSGFLVLMSLAGGTGSGLGAFISHGLSDMFPKEFLVNQVICPYSNGEVVLQNYNTVLTLSHLYQSSNAIIMLQNDHLSRLCTKQLGFKDVSFNDLNSIISHKLASVFLPTSLENALGNSPNCLHELLNNLCAHPSFKLLSLKNIPYMTEKSLAYSTFIWPALVKHLRQMLIADSPMEEGIDWEVKLPSNTVLSDLEAKEGFPIRKENFNKSISNLLIARGKDLHLLDCSPFLTEQLYVPWVPAASRMTVQKQHRPFNQYEKSLTLLSNSQSCIKPLDKIVQKAWNTFAARAYFHQYERYGLSEDDFVDSIASVEQIISDYSEL